MAHLGHAHSDASDDMSLPPEPARPDVGKGRVIVVVAILTCIMQGLFVVNSAHEMHLWADTSTLAQGKDLWTVDSANAIELPPMSSAQQ